MIDIHAEDGQMHTAIKGDGFTIMAELAMATTNVLTQMCEGGDLEPKELGLRFVNVFGHVITHRDEFMKDRPFEEEKEDEQMDGLKRIRPLRPSRKGS